LEYILGFMDNLTPQQVEEKRIKDQKRNDLKWVLSTPQGRRFIWGLMSEGNIFNERYHTDSNYNFVTKGVRMFCQNIFNDVLQAEPEAYLKMIQENEAKKVRENIKQEKQISGKINNPLKIDSPSLPNTEAEMSMGGSR